MVAGALDQYMRIVAKSSELFGCEWERQIVNLHARQSFPLPRARRLGDVTRWRGASLAGKCIVSHILSAPCMVALRLAALLSCARSRPAAPLQFHEAPEFHQARLEDTSCAPHVRFGCFLTGHPSTIACSPRYQPLTTPVFKSICT